MTRGTASPPLRPRARRASPRPVAPAPRFAPPVAPVLAGIAAALLLAACGGGKERTPPDHVLLILVDTLRADHLGSYGHPDRTTPAMDSIAARGVRFERAYSQCSWTAPSMVSLFTGRYLADPRLDVPADLPTLAESFQQAGWRTGAFIMNDIVNADAGFARGFERFEQFVPYSSNEPILEWLAETADERTFTYVHLNEAHDPYGPLEDHLTWRVDRHLNRRRAPEPVPAERRHYYQTVRDRLALQGDFDGEVSAIETELGGYVDDVAFTDEKIGELLAALERHGLAERAAVVITSDHGEGLWTREAMMTGTRRQAAERGEAPSLLNVLHPTHGNQVTPELIHVPWLLAAPGVPAGVVIDGPVELVDLFPTLLEVCDLPIPHGLQGVSRMPSIEGRAQEPAEAFSHTRFNSTLITADGWQVIVPTEQGICEEGLLPALYNLAEDPDARDNLAVEEPEVYAELAARARARRAEGIPNEVVQLDEVTLQRLEALGYVSGDGQGLTVGTGPSEAALARPLEELLAELETSILCPERLLAARVLALRADELDEAVRQRLRDRLDEETSPAVRDELERALR